jgi:hypothetical protein
MSIIKPMPAYLARLLSPDTTAVTFAPFGVYIKKQYLTDGVTVRHEFIHWRQQWEMALLPFYLWYGIEWSIRRIFGYPYEEVSFEREAYDNDEKITYLDNRLPYSWVKYL